MKDFFAILLFGAGCICLGLNLFMWILYRLTVSHVPDVRDDGSRWFAITFCFSATLISMLLFVGYISLKGWMP